MGMTLEPKDKMRAARVINDWRNHERPFEDTPYWSKRFAAVEEVFEKTRPTSPVVLWRNERTDIDNQYDKRFTSWSRRPELVEGFGWGKRRMVWVYVKPSAVMVDVSAFGPKIDRDQMQEVILKPGQYRIEEFPKNSLMWRDAKRPPLSESWDPEERAKRAKKCGNPKGFTMRQFCKNQKTRSKPGQKTNEEEENEKILHDIVKEVLLREEVSQHHS